MRIESDNILSSLSNTASSSYEKNKIDSFKKELDKAGRSQDKKEILKVAQEFEAFFIKNIFKSMRQMEKLSDVFVDKSFDREMYEQMMDEKMSESISQGRGIGLADQLYKQMIKQYGYGDEETNDSSIDILK